jgi:hypothetical protein
MPRRMSTNELLEQLLLYSVVVLSEGDALKGIRKAEASNVATPTTPAPSFSSEVERAREEGINPEATPVERPKAGRRS